MSTTNSLKIIALDDHPVITDGLKLLLNKNTKFNLCAAVHSWEKLISKAEKEIPDIIILDLNIPGENILVKLKSFCRQYPAVKVLIFSSYNAPSLVKRSFAHGANGYLLKDTSQEELCNALTTIANDEIYIGKRVAVSKKPKKELLPFFELKDNFAIIQQLTPREKQLVKLIAKGYESQIIADQLFISFHTVQSHRKSIMRKLNLHSAADITRFAFENKLI